MKAHVQNPWTKSPTVMVNMSVEHVQQLASALDWVTPDGVLSANELDAVQELRRVLKHALETERPHGIRSVVP